MCGGGVPVYFDSGHIPTVDEWHEHEKPTFYGISRKQLAVFGGTALPRHHQESPFHDSHARQLPPSLLSLSHALS
jgi:hypothetical protein